MKNLGGTSRSRRSGIYSNTGSNGWNFVRFLFLVHIEKLPAYPQCFPKRIIQNLGHLSFYELSKSGIFTCNFEARYWHKSLVYSSWGYRRKTRIRRNRLPPCCLLLERRHPPRWPGLRQFHPRIDSDQTTSSSFSLLYRDQRKLSQIPWKKVNRKEKNRNTNSRGKRKREEKKDIPRISKRSANLWIMASFCNCVVRNWQKFRGEGKTASMEKISLTSGLEGRSCRSERLNETEWASVT